MKEDDRPNCCERGNEFISWYINRPDDYGKLFTGWGMMVDYKWEDAEIAEISYCPFCGKKLDVIND